MSVRPMKVRLAGELSDRPTRRVREEVKDGLAVIAFSAAASLAVAIVLTIFAHLVG